MHSGASCIRTVLWAEPGSLLSPPALDRTVSLMRIGPLICPFWACSSAWHLVGPQLIFINCLM